MSLVIAIKNKDRIVLGADKQASIGDSKEHTYTKIWEVEELPGAIMGSVGAVRCSQIIQYSNIIDKNFVNAENLSTDFIICSLVPTIIAGLKQNGINLETKDDLNCEMMPNQFIFAYKDKAWVIGNDFSVSELSEYFAIGSGSDVAKGALYATEDKNPFERIVTAIDAAAETTLFVDHGIDLLVTEHYQDDAELAAVALGLKKPKVETKPKKKKAKKE